MSLLSSCQYRLVLFSVFVMVVHGQQMTGLGTVQQQVPWRAGHASAYLPPYVIVYGGSEDITTTMSSNTMGSTSLWAWDSRNGSWYHPTTQVQGGVEMLPQVYHKATSLSGQSTMVALVSNTTGGQATGVLQKLDINSWSWSFPTSNFQASAKAVGFTMTTLNNTIYTYGGLAVNANGFPNPNAVQNTLSLIDTNSFQISPGSNGLGLTDHSTCYLKKCNCLVTFGGTTTGNPTEVTDAVNLYDLNAKVWNVQGINTVSSAEKPGARRLHTANCLDDAMIVYGGGTDQPSDTNVWILNATNYPQLTWQRKDMVNATLGPNLRMGHTSVYDEVNKKIYMFGGWGVTATNDSNMYVLDTVNWSWNKVATTGYPSNGVPWTNITNPIDPTTTSHGLGAGAIAGIAVGVLLALLALAAIIFYCIRKHQREQRDKDFMVAENLSETMAPHDELKRDNNPYNEPQQEHDDDGYDAGGYYTSNTHYNSATRHNKRTSKAWTGTMSTQHSFTTAHRSEIGDSERVVTGILEEVDDGTVNATHGSHSPRNSFRNSKVLLVVPSTDISGQGQVPNEIISQKPNEFSIPAHRLQQHNIPVQHVTDEEGAPLSSSMEVLRSIKTNPSSMMNQPGSQFSHVRKNGIPITHATIEDDDEWNTSDSVSVHNKGPIQYILPNSHQLSTATSTQTWDTTKDQRQMVNHHYPSSTLNMPMAEAVTPPVTTNNSSHELSDTPATTPPVNIYNSVSPLDALASLGQSHTPNSSRHGSSTILKDMQSSGHSTPSNEPLFPLINALPRRYQLDKSKSPITGPTNNILFAINNQDKPVALKAFGRREAWERECKSLIKLKSDCVVEILEVLTIQSDHPTTGSEEVEGEIKYVTVMERLDETLNTFIRKQNNTRGVARDILKCLSWCHDNGIAFCDLKPSNIMHDKGSSWKLIDFEASRTINEECVGVITPRYCPPEVARATTYGLEGANGVVATASVDLWSFGCILYELETKKALFPSNIKDETVLHFVSHPSPSTPILNNGLRWNEQKELEIPQLDRLVSNSHTRQLIKTLLKRDPSKRGSASQLLENPYFL